MYIMADIKKIIENQDIYIWEQRRLLIFSDTFFYVKDFIFNKYICEIL